MKGEEMKEKKMKYQEYQLYTLSRLAKTNLKNIVDKIKNDDKKNHTIGYKNMASLLISSNKEKAVKAEHIDEISSKKFTLNLYKEHYISCIEENVFSLYKYTEKSIPSKEIVSDIESAIKGDYSKISKKEMERMTKAGVIVRKALSRSGYVNIVYQKLKEDKDLKTKALELGFKTTKKWLESLSLEEFSSTTYQLGLTRISASLNSCSVEKTESIVIKRNINKKDQWKETVSLVLGIDEEEIFQYIEDNEQFKEIFNIGIFLEEIGREERDIKETLDIQQDFVKIFEKRTKSLATLSKYAKSKEIQSPAIPKNFNEANDESNFFSKQTKIKLSLKEEELSRSDYFNIEIDTKNLVSYLYKFKMFDDLIKKDSLTFYGNFTDKEKMNSYIEIIQGMQNTNKANKNQGEEHEHEEQIIMEL